jgi:hypothetical protein
MAINYSYPIIDEVQGDDLILLADASKQNQTKSASVSQLASYIGTTSGDSALLKEKTIVLEYGQLSILNGGGNILSYDVPGYTSTSAISMVDVTAYLEAGTTPFDATEPLLIGLGGLLDFEPRNQINHITLLNSSSSVYYNSANRTVLNNYLTPTPLGATLGIKFDGSGAVTQGNGTLTLKILYRLLDFS